MTSPLLWLSTRLPLTLPVPLASDSFNRAALGSTDGAGHEFPGGAGLAWTSQHGTWAIFSNKLRCSVLGATPALAFATVDTGTANVILVASVATTAATGAGFVMRYVDKDNCVYCYINSSNMLTVKKRVAGVESVVFTTAATLVNGYEMVAIVNGTSFALYYNGVYVNTGTIEDAVLQTSTLHGAFANAASSLLNLDYFSAWPLTAPPAAALRAVRVYRETGTDYLVRVPIPGETSRIVAEYRLRKIDSVLDGWAVPSNCWHILGLKVIDLDGVATTRILGNAEVSAYEYAYTIGADADLQADYNFYGSVHQAQVNTAAAITLDGTDISTLPIGLSAYGNRLTVTQAMNTIYPKDKATVIGTSALTHLFDRAFVEVQHSHTYETGYKIFAAYSGMLPTNNDDAAGIDTYQVGGNDAAERVYDDGVKNINTQTDHVEGRHSSAHAYRVRMTLPSGGPDDAGDWSKAGGYKVWFQDRAPATTGTGKFYVNWVSTNFADRVAAVASSHRTRYQVVKA